MLGIILSFTLFVPLHHFVSANRWLLTHLCVCCDWLAVGWWVWPVVCSSPSPQAAFPQVGSVTVVLASFIGSVCNSFVIYKPVCIYIKRKSVYVAIIAVERSAPADAHKSLSLQINGCNGCIVVRNVISNVCRRMF